MDPRELLEFADRIASDLLTIGRENQISAKDLVMAAAIAQSLIQTAVFPGDEPGVNAAVQEAGATLQAANTLLVVN